MGLDMFLNGVNYYPAEYDEKHNITKKRQIVHTLEIYWRKANHIHKWFVDNVQWGQDDCRDYDVSLEQLIELRNTCAEVLKHPERAKELLPTKEGFFFGPTEYDEYYFEELKFTIDEIDKLRNNLEESEYDWFEYYSSW